MSSMCDPITIDQRRAGSFIEALRDAFGNNEGIAQEQISALVLKHLSLFDDSRIPKKSKDKIIEIVSSSKACNSKIGTVQKILQRCLSLPTGWVSKSPDPLFKILSEDAERVHATIKQTAGYLENALSVTDSTMQKMVVKKGIPSHTAQLNQYRFKMGETIYHFWGDSHSFLGIETWFVEEFGKLDAKGKANHFQESIGVKKIRGIHPTEPNGRAFLFGRLASLCCELETSMKTVEQAAEEFARILTFYEDLMAEVVENAQHSEEGRDFVEFSRAFFEIVSLAESWEADILTKERIEKLSKVLSKDKLVAVIKYSSLKLASHSSIPRAVQEQMNLFSKGGYKDKAFVDKLTLSFAFDLRDQGIAQQLFSNAKPGIDTTAFLGFRHIAGVVKHLYRLHGIDLPFEDKGDRKAGDGSEDYKKD